MTVLKWCFKTQNGMFWVFEAKWSENYTVFKIYYGMHAYNIDYIHFKTTLSVIFNLSLSLSVFSMFKSSLFAHSPSILHKQSSVQDKLLHHHDHLNMEQSGFVDTLPSQQQPVEQEEPALWLAANGCLCPNSSQIVEAQKAIDAWQWVGT